MNLKQMIDYLNKEKLSMEEEQWLVAQFTAQEVDLGRLGVVLFPERLCRACEAVLPDYVHLEISGGDAVARYPRVAAHLGECEECTTVYAELTEMVTLAYADGISTQTHTPQFDLSFLQERAVTTSIWQQLSQGGRQVQQLFTQIRVQIAQDIASFGKLPFPLQPIWIDTPALRDAGTRQGQLLPLPLGEPDLSFHIIIGPVAGKQANLSIEVKRPSTDQPLARIRITLQDEGHHLLASELTGTNGRVTFPRLAAGHYFLEIKLRDRIWELPMHFTWQPE